MAVLLMPIHIDDTGPESHGTRELRFKCRVRRKEPNTQVHVISLQNFGVTVTPGIGSCPRAGHIIVTQKRAARLPDLPPMMLRGF